MTERITLAEVRKVATLARLSLTDEELDRTRGQLDGILDWMATLNELDTTGVEPTYHAVAMVTPLREDVPGATLRPEEVLRAAAKSEAGAFAVPKVLEGE